MREKDHKAIVLSVPALDFIKKKNPQLCFELRGRKKAAIFIETSRDRKKNYIYFDIFCFIRC